MKQIQHVVFDIGQLLIRWDPELIYLDRIPNPSDRASFLRNICNAKWNEEQDRGRDWTEAEDLLIEEHPAHEEDIRAYRKHWVKSIPYAYFDVANLLTDLVEAGRDITMLTNFNQHTFIDARKKFGFLDKPRGVTVSGEVRMIKPEPEIFVHHSNTFGLDPEATIFIDDSAANIEAARNAGWRAIHFAGRQGAPKLHAELHRHGIEF